MTLPEALKQIAAYKEFVKCVRDMAVEDSKNIVKNIADHSIDVVNRQWRSQRDQALSLLDSKLK